MSRVRLGRPALLSGRRPRRPPHGRRPPARGGPRHGFAPHLGAGACAQDQAFRAPAAGLRPDRAGRAAARQGREHGDPGACGRERDRRRRTSRSPAPSASARRTGSAPISWPRELGALGRAASRISTLQLVALPRTPLAVEARGGRRHHARAAEGGTTRRPQAHRLPAQALCRRRPISTVTRPSARRRISMPHETIVTYVPDLIFTPGARLSRRGLEKDFARGCEAPASWPSCRRCWRAPASACCRFMRGPDSAWSFGRLPDGLHRARPSGSSSHADLKDVAASRRSMDFLVREVQSRTRRLFMP